MNNFREGAESAVLGVLEITDANEANSPIASSYSQELPVLRECEFGGVSCGVRVFYDARPVTGSPKLHATLRVGYGEIPPIR